MQQIKLAAQGNKDMIKELVDIKAGIGPTDTLLVPDAMMCQEAVASTKFRSQHICPCTRKAPFIAIPRSNKSNSLPVQVNEGMIQELKDIKAATEPTARCPLHDEPGGSASLGTGTYAHPNSCFLRSPATQKASWEQVHGWCR
jgi:hypothetical protein